MSVSQALGMEVISSTDMTTTPSTSPSKPPPTIPARSPLRPPRSLSRPDSVSQASEGEAQAMPAPTVVQARSFGSFSNLLDALHRESQHSDDSATLVVPPHTPPPDDDETPMMKPKPAEELLAVEEVVPEVETPTATKPVSKRTHAMLELLNSERAYASDLALIRDVHIPLALGEKTPFPLTPPQSSSSSERTLSTFSDSSASSNKIPLAPNRPSTATTSATAGSADQQPPMSKEDARAIFSNIAELAMFADMFSEELEKALGGIVEGGEGEDYVGQVFIDVIPQISPMYTYYITRHPTALAHLNKLTSSPSASPTLATYLSHTRTLAQSLTHAWDLPSLLIKPVQRLLKYALLLGAILDETPEGHPDKERLRLAKTMMERVGWEVNEGRRRREIVREVLVAGGVIKPPVGEGEGKGEGSASGGITATGAAGETTTSAAKRRGGAGIALAVAAAKLKPGAPGTKGGGGGGSVAAVSQEENEEAERVKAMEKEMKEIETFIEAFAADAVSWAKESKEMTVRLSAWAKGFAKVLGIPVVEVSADPQGKPKPGEMRPASPTPVTQEGGSEALDAFVRVVDKHLMESCTDIAAIIKEHLLPQLAILMSSTKAPHCLLSTMHNLEPAHHALLHHNISKGRPPAVLLEASTSYLALRSQLNDELPHFLALFHKGVFAAVQSWTVIHAQWWQDVRYRWRELWDCLRVEGERNEGLAMTERIWKERWFEPEQAVNALAIVHPPKVQLKARKSLRKSDSSATSVAGGLGKAGTVAAMFGSLETTIVTSPSESVFTMGSGSSYTPAGNHAPGSYPSSHHQSQKGRTSLPSSFDSQSQFSQNYDPSLVSSRRRGHTLRSKDSDESLRSIRSAKSGKLSSQQQRQSTYSGHSGHSGHSALEIPLVPQRGPSPSPSSSVSSSKRSSMPMPLRKAASQGKMFMDTLSRSPKADETFDREETEERDRDKDRGRGQRKGKLDHLMDSIRPPVKRRSSSRKGRQQKLDLNLEVDTPEYSPPLYETFHRHQNPPLKRTTSTTAAHSGHTHSHSQSYNSHPYANPDAHGGLARSTRTLHYASPASTPPTSKWRNARPLYSCRVIHACEPPDGVSYYGLPFFRLELGDVFDVLKEAGHPSVHEDLPLYVDDGDDCLLLARETRGSGEIGWVLASFLYPVD